MVCRFLLISHRQAIKLLRIGTVTFRFEQRVKTQIRLFLQEQSDQGLHSLPFCLRLSDGSLVLLHCRARLFHFRTVTVIFSVSKVFKFYGILKDEVDANLVPYIFLSIFSDYLK